MEVFDSKSHGKEVVQILNLPLELFAEERLVLGLPTLLIFHEINHYDGSAIFGHQLVEMFPYESMKTLQN